MDTSVDRHAKPRHLVALGCALATTCALAALAVSLAATPPALANDASETSAATTLLVPASDLSSHGMRRVLAGQGDGVPARSIHDENEGASEGGNNENDDAQGLAQGLAGSADGNDGEGNAADAEGEGTGGCSDGDAGGNRTAKSANGHGAAEGSDEGASGNCDDDADGRRVAESAVQYGTAPLLLLSASPEEGLPTSYNAVEEGFATPVKDQQCFGLCWAFGTLAAIESSLLAHGQASVDDLDLSERHLAYFTYHAFDDPLRYMNRDLTRPTPTGQYGDSLPDPSLMAGGNSLIAAHALTTWRGAADESVAPYDALTEAYWQRSIDTARSDGDADAKTAADETFLANTALGDDVAFADAWHVSGAWLIDLKDIDDVKKAIREYGGATMSMYYDDTYCNYEPTAGAVTTGDDTRTDDAADDAATSDPAAGDLATGDASDAGARDSSVDPAAGDAADADPAAADANASDAADADPAASDANASDAADADPAAGDANASDAADADPAAADADPAATTSAGIDFAAAPAYYYYNGYNTNHIVTIVGWDDNYSAKNFKTDYSWVEGLDIDTSSFANNTKEPSHDGAWLVKNSYGDYWGNGGGYFWLSYDDTAANSSSSKVHVFEMQPADDYDHLYAHDGSTGWSTRSMKSGGCIANAFVAKGNSDGAEALDAVSFELDDVNVDYSIQVYTGISDPADPTSGTPALHSPVTGKTSYAGYYTVQLPQAVLLTEGERYAVAVTLSHASNTSVRYAVDDSSSVSWAKFTSAVHPSESFSWHPDVTYADTGKLYIDDLALTQNIASSQLSGGTAKDWNGCVARVKALTHDVNLRIDDSAYVYDGSAKTPSVTLYGKDGNALVEGEDYAVAYEDNVNAGTGTVRIQRLGGYCGTIAKTFRIEPATLTAATSALVGGPYTYDGAAKRPGLSLAGQTLASGKDYTAAYAGNVAAGTAKATFTGKGNYSGTVTKTFAIAKASLAPASASLSATSFTYSGTAKRPSVKVVLGGRTLASGKDYTVSYARNTVASTAKSKASVTVTGTGNYAGTVTKAFTIKRAALKAAGTTLVGGPFTYNGTAKRPSVKVVLGGRTLASGKDYTVSYARNVAAGTAKSKASVTVTGRGNYAGTVTKTFAIAKASNPMKLTTKAKTASLAKLKKGKVVISGAVTAKKAQGKVTFSLVKALKGKKSFKKRFAVSAGTGKITVKKGTKKGTYKLTVKATAKGTANYKSLAKSVTCTIKVK